jgi:hypothetical protein
MPRRRTVLLAILLVLVAASAAVLGASRSGPTLTSAAAAASSTQIEAARKADAAAAAGVQSAEAALAAARATRAATAQTVAALEAEPAPEEPSGATVAKAPLGPPGSWTPVFADGFAKPVGSAGDTFWLAKTNEHGCCNNTSPNETSSEAPSAVHWSEANGLELRCEALVCSGVSTTGFTYQLGRGASFVFQAVAEMPNNSLGGGEDPGFWSKSTTRWPPELDMFEWWGWGSCESTPSTCVGGFPVYKSAGLGSNEQYYRPGETGWTRFHTYTTVVEGSTFTEYVDGARTQSFTQAVNTDAMNMILTHAVRVSTKPRNTSFNLRSIAVYEDSAHARQFVTGGGVAPGTTVK